MPKLHLTAEQYDALVAYAAKYGDNWKEKLSNAWLNGADANEPNGHLLRQVRNRLGPSWLAKFNPKTHKVFKI